MLENAEGRRRCLIHLTMIAAAALSVMPTFIGSASATPGQSPTSVEVHQALVQGRAKMASELRQCRTHLIQVRALASEIDRLNRESNDVFAKVTKICRGAHHETVGGEER